MEYVCSRLLQVPRTPLEEIQSARDARGDVDHEAARDGCVHSVRSVATELREALVTIFMVNDADGSVLGNRDAAGVVYELEEV